MKGLGATLTYTELGDIQSAVTVQTTDSTTKNGENLIAAYAKAKTLTPNGAALSATNRACVIVPPGKYNLDHGVAGACVPLTLDTEFVDIIGLTSDRSLQHIYGTPEATNSGVIVQTANDVHISNLTVEILTAIDEPNEDSTDSAAYFPSTNLNSTVIDNCYFIGYQEVVNTSILWSMRLNIEYSGIFTNNKCGDLAFGYQGSASGTFTNCIGGSASFGTAGIASGTFTNCTGGDSSFGANGILSGLINFCNISGSEFTVPTASVATITLVAGGTGYTANDELTVVGGTGPAATIKVLTVNAGVILTVEILTVGSYTVEPENAVAVTGGTGNNDATFDLTWHEGHVYGCIDSTGFIAEVNWNDGA
jgi:hypothetical protein